MVISYPITGYKKDFFKHSNRGTLRSVIIVPVRLFISDFFIYPLVQIVSSSTLIKVGMIITERQIEATIFLY